MIGLKLPKLFYGRKQRQAVVGVRADFCEFCAIVSRHWVISFQSAPTLFFVPFQYEEIKRETRCEVCRAQFAMGDEACFEKTSTNDCSNIESLIQQTNPEVEQHALIELEQMKKRTGEWESGRTELIEQTRLKNFFRRHETDLKERLREFLPFVAVTSIQATILGLALSAFVHWSLAISFAISLFVFAVLGYFLLIRKRIQRMFDQSALRLLAVSGKNDDLLGTAIGELASRFPHSSAIVYRQLIQLSSADLKRFANGKDFISLVDKLDQIPEI